MENIIVEIPLEVVQGIMQDLGEIKLKRSLNSYATLLQYAEGAKAKAEVKAKDEQQEKKD